MADQVFYKGFKSFYILRDVLLVEDKITKHNLYQKFF